jgi:hypothetical protein
MDEVPRLRAVRDAGPVGAEQTRRLAARGLLELVEHDRGHAPLVVLVRAVDVEEAQARPLRRRRHPAHEHVGHAPVEGELRPAIEVERPEPGQRLGRGVVLEALRAVAVDRGGGGVDEGDLPFRAGGPEEQRQGQVGGRHQVAIGCRGGADGPHVQHGVERRVGREEVLDLLRRQDAGNRVLREVAPLRPLAQAVHHHHFRPARGQRRHQVGADETGPARDKIHA